MGGVTVLTALAKVNQAVDTGNSGFVYQALQVIFISFYFSFKKNSCRHSYKGNEYMKWLT